MPKLTCPCGEVINLSEVPVADEQILLPTAEWDHIIETLAEAASRVGTEDQILLREALSDALAPFGSAVYRCARCGRLIVFDNSTGVAEFFTPEAPPTN